MKLFKTKIGRLRVLAFLEGITLLMMVFISVPLRTIYGYSGLSSILGPIHGGLFLLFIFNTLSVDVEYQWKFKKTTWKVLIACIIPFGTFYVDHKILKAIYDAETA